MRFGSLFVVFWIILYMNIGRFEGFSFYLIVMLFRLVIFCFLVLYILFIELYGYLVSGVVEDNYN